MITHASITCAARTFANGSARRCGVAARRHRRLGGLVASTTPLQESPSSGPVAEFSPGTRSQCIPRRRRRPVARTLPRSSTCIAANCPVTSNAPPPQTPPKNVGCGTTCPSSTCVWGVAGGRCRWGVAGLGVGRELGNGPGLLPSSSRHGASEHALATPCFALFSLAGVPAMRACRPKELAATVCSQHRSRGKMQIPATCRSRAGLTSSCGTHSPSCCFTRLRPTSTTGLPRFHLR